MPEAIAAEPCLDLIHPLQAVAGSVRASSNFVMQVDT